MSQVIAIFQIGPVQEFITCAKKTQDFWSGSYLLSYLNCVAMDTVIQGSGGNPSVIVYPALQCQGLYQYVVRLRTSGKRPWELRPQPDELRPTIPNRFVALLDDKSTAKTLLKGAGDKVGEVFRVIAGSVQDRQRQALNRYITDPSVWNGIWNRQTQNVFEIYWSVSPLDVTNYSQSYRQAEAAFGARKAIRNFVQPDPEPGFKCTLCGQREPLHAMSGGSLDRQHLMGFWADVRLATGHRFREGEHLCALCTTKRLAPDYVFCRSHEIPSTSTVAVGDFLSQLVCVHQRAPAGSSSGPSLVNDFVSKARQVARSANLDFSIEPLPKLDTSTDLSLKSLLALDGDWFLEETYENLIRRPPKGVQVNPTDVVQAQKTLDELVTWVHDGAEALEIPARGPKKYYAIFATDGDDMGKLIEAARSPNDHRELSNALCTFSLTEVHRVIEQDYLGKVIYFGGDEGVAFVTLDNLLPMIEQCRKTFSTTLRSRPATTCIGAIIAHHQQALLQVLREVRIAIEWAKELQKVDDRKDGFCLGIMKQSGGTTYARAHWEYNGISVIQALHDLVGHYQAGRLSDRWWRQLAQEEWGLKQVVRTPAGQRVVPNLELICLEISRLVARHADTKQMEALGPSALDTLIQTLQELAIAIHDWEAFMGLMEAATYIARGGGR